MKAIIWTYLALLLSTFTFAQNLTIFDRPNTTILISMPANEDEFYNIFKRKPGSGELENIIDLLNQYKDLKNVYILQKSSDIKLIMDYIMTKGNEREYDEYIPRIGFSIVGHNDKGDFYFPDGSNMQLEDIEKELMGIPGMFLSCNAKTHGVTGVDYKLTYGEALEIASDFDNILTDIHNKRLCNIFFDSPRKIASTMINQLNFKSKVKYTVRFLGASALTGGFVLLKKIDDSDNNNQHSDSTDNRQ